MNKRIGTPKHSAKKKTSSSTKTKPVPNAKPNGGGSTTNHGTTGSAG